jgi:PKD domain
MWRDRVLSRRLPLLVFLAVAVSAMALSGTVRAATGISITSVQEAGLDTDRDGLYDVIRFNVTIDANASGRVYVLAGINGTQQGQNISSVVQGSQVIEVWFWGWELYNAGIDGPYAVNIQIRDYSTYTTLNETWITTRAYAHTQFDPPGALVTSLGADWPVDTNGNGRYDEIRFNYTLAVIDPETYTIQGRLSKGIPIANINRQVHLAAGNVSGTFVIPGGLVNVSGQDGPYLFELTALTPIRYSGSLPSSMLSVTTRAYTWSQFDPPYVHFGSPLTDEGRDLDRDGLYDEIVVHVPLHLDRPATVALSGTFANASLNLYDNLSPQPLPAGDVTLNLTFPTYALYANALDGPYQLNLDFRVTELGYWGEYRPYATAPYAHTQFSPPSVSLGATPTSVVEDPDGNGLFDALTVNLTLNVLRSGDFFLDCRLFAGSQGLEDARYRHFTIGTTIASLRFSGIGVNRLGQDGPWSVYCWITRLDGLPGDQISASLTTASLVRSAFEFRDPATLSGTVRSSATGSGLAYSIVVVLDPSQDFWTWFQTDAAGRYSLALYNSSWVLAVATEYPDAQPVVQSVSVSGPTTQDLTLGPTPTSGIRWNANFTQWNASVVDHTRTYAALNQTVRFNADYLGNRNGIADASELATWSAYPALLPYPSPVRFPPTSYLGVSVDGVALTANSEVVTGVAGAGSLFLDQPVRVSRRTLLANPAPPTTGLQHGLKVTMPYDQPSFETNLTVTLPPRIAVSTAAATPNVTLSQTSPRSWLIDPNGNPFQAAPIATAWINATIAPDTEAPLAHIAGPSLAERGAPVTLDGSASTDDVAVTNYSWSLTVNGTTRVGYAATFTTSFSNIGTFVARLTVRDAAGNSNSTDSVITVRDTQPPSPPTGLVAQVQDVSGSARVALSWSAVSSDDLAGYVVYRSSDGGITFARLTSTPVGTTAYTDRNVSTGATYVYRVTALDRYGNESPPVTSAPATVPAAPAPAPLDVGIVVGIAAIGIAAVAIGVAWLYRSRRRPPPVV